MQKITSRDNKKIKLLSKLLSSEKERSESGLIVLEGLRIIKDANKAKCNILELYVTESGLKKSEKELLPFLSSETEVILIEDFILSKITDTKNPQGIVALCKENLLRYQLPEDMSKGSLLLCSLQDPGNMGTLLRSAAAFSLSAVIITNDCPHITSPKVLRASMGCAFKLPIVSFCNEYEALDALKKHSVPVFAAYLSKDSKQIHNVDLKGACVAIGNEGNGLNSQFAEKCDEKIIIPIDESSESLNAAVAGSIIAWELKRSVSSI